MSQTIELYIDRIVLHGFEGRNRFEIGAAIEKELSRLLSEEMSPDNFTKGGHTEAVSSNNFQYNKASRSNLVGEQIAGSIFQSVNNVTTSNSSTSF